MHYDYEDCHRCHTPKVPGHRLVCAFHAVSEISFWIAALCLLTFWIALAMFVGTHDVGRKDDLLAYVVLFAANAGLLFLLSIATGMRAKWLRHAIVMDMEDYLDEEGSCCGGACAGSCGPAGCDDGACDIDESALPSDDEEGGCCGGGCCR